MSIASNSSPAVFDTCIEEERRSSYNITKKPRYSWYVTLESESSVPTDEDDESIYTMQGNETEFAYDTADTCTSIHTCTSSNESNFHVEYDLDSRSENENKFVYSSSSEPENILSVKVRSCSGTEGLADDSEDSTSSINNDMKRIQFWTCIQCGKQNSNILFRYCSSCYQMRKTTWSRHRPRRKRAFLKGKRAMISAISAKENDNRMESDEQHTQSSENLCLMCAESPKNGVFVHGKITHICCCYRCALKVWTTNGNRCPICNRKVSQILKAFYA